MALTSVASAFVADTGGTNLRLALCTADGTCTKPALLHCADYGDLASALRTALGQIGEPLALRLGALAVAGPITGDSVRITNRDWTFSAERLRRELGLERLIVVNDAAASTLALPHLAHNEADQFGGGTPDPAATMVMLAPGTGLGVAGLIPSSTGWTPVPSEAGHADFAPADDRDIEILH
jgi:glucokinase